MSAATRTAVLVTGAGGITGVTVIRALRAAALDGLILVAADCQPLTAGQAFADHHAILPTGASEDFAQELLARCLEHGVELVIPTLDIELAPLARARPSFTEHGIEVAVADCGTIAILNDKWLTHRFFAERGISAPAARQLDDDWTPAGPVLLKPRFGSGSQGILRLEDEHDLAWARRRFDGDHYLQEWIDGEEFTVDVLADSQGEVRSAVARRRLATKAGVTYIGCTTDDVALTAGARWIAGELGLRGPANLQCLRREDRLFWIEGNPRFSGGLALTVGAGVNGPAALVEWLRRGRSAPLPNARPGVTMLRYWAEHYVGA